MNAEETEREEEALDEDNEGNEEVMNAEETEREEEVEVAWE